MDLIIVGPILDLIDFKILQCKIKPALCKNVCSNGSKRGGPFSYETLQTSYFFLSVKTEVDKRTQQPILGS